MNDVFPLTSILFVISFRTTVKNIFTNRNYQALRKWLVTLTIVLVGLRLSPATVPSLDAQ